MNRKNSVKKIAAAAFAVVSLTLPFTSVCAMKRAPSTPDRQEQRVCPGAPKKQRTRRQPSERDRTEIQISALRMQLYFQTANEGLYRLLGGFQDESLYEWCDMMAKTAKSPSNASSAA